MSRWLPFVLLTVLSWGTYIPTMHKGQVALNGSGVHAFLMVGVAYVLVAIAIPGVSRCCRRPPTAPQIMLLQPGLTLQQPTPNQLCPRSTTGAEPPLPTRAHASPAARRLEAATL